MEEKADPVLVTALPQRLRERNQMIVVHPQAIAGLDDLVELVGEMRIDPPIT